MYTTRLWYSDLSNNLTITSNLQTFKIAKLFICYRLASFYRYPIMLWLFHGLGLNHSELHYNQTNLFTTQSYIIISSMENYTLPNSFWLVVAWISTSLASPCENDVVCLDRWFYYLELVKKNGSTLCFLHIHDQQLWTLIFCQR